MLWLHLIMLWLIFIIVAILQFKKFTAGSITDPSGKLTLSDDDDMMMTNN